jgi:hypothetical protein
MICYNITIAGASARTDVGVRAPAGAASPLPLNNLRYNDACLRMVRVRVSPKTPTSYHQIAHGGMSLERPGS